MTNVVQFGTRMTPSSPKSKVVIPTANAPANLHITEPQSYSLETIGVGVSIAIQLTHDFEAAVFLMNKFKEAVLAHEIFVHLNLEETRKYLDYLDIHQSPRNSQLRIELAMCIYS